MSFIGESVRSILNQDFQSFELIVVDDGSTDQTVNEVNKFRDSRIRIIRQKNSGQSVAANRGANVANGAFIKFVDADDLINPEHLSSQIEAIHHHPRHLASCRWGYFLSDPTKCEIRPMSTDLEALAPLDWLTSSISKDDGMMGGWTWLIPREVWEKSGGWDERLSLNNDFDFSIRLVLASDGVRFAPNASYAYRKGIPSSLSGSYGRKAMESAWLTTYLGTTNLLVKDNSPRMQQLCADRFQSWLFQFYPEFPDLVDKTEARIKELGGSAKTLDGGILLESLLPILGWKGVRQLQALARKLGWNQILKRKQTRRLSNLENRKSFP